MASRFRSAAVGCTTACQQDAYLTFGVQTNETNSVFTLLHSWFLPSTPANTGSRRLSRNWRSGTTDHHEVRSGADAGDASAQVAAGCQRATATESPAAATAPSSAPARAHSPSAGGSPGRQVEPLVGGSSCCGREEPAHPGSPASPDDAGEQARSPAAADSLSADAAAASCSVPVAGAETNASTSGSAGDAALEGPASSPPHAAAHLARCGTPAPHIVAGECGSAPLGAPPAELQQQQLQQEAPSCTEPAELLPLPQEAALHRSSPPSAVYDTGGPVQSQPLTQPLLDEATSAGGGEGGSMASSPQASHRSSLTAYPTCAETSARGGADGAGGGGGGGGGIQCARSSLGCFALDSAAAAAAAAAARAAGIAVSCDGDSASIADSAASTESANPMAAAHAARVAFRMSVMTHGSQQPQPQLSGRLPSTSSVSELGAVPASPAGSSGWERTRAASSTGMSQPAGGRAAAAAAASPGGGYGGAGRALGRAYSSGGERPPAPGSVGGGLPHPQQRHMATALSEPAGQVTASPGSANKRTSIESNASAAGLAQSQLRLEHLHAKHLQLWRQYERLSATQAAQAAQTARQEGLIAAQEEELRAMRRHCEELRARNQELQGQLSSVTSWTSAMSGSGGVNAMRGSGERTAVPAGGGGGGFVGGGRPSSSNGAAQRHESIGGATAYGGRGCGRSYPMRPPRGSNAGSSSGSSSDGGVAGTPVASAAAIRFHNNPLMQLGADAGSAQGSGGGGMGGAGEYDGMARSSMSSLGGDPQHVLYGSYEGGLVSEAGGHQVVEAMRPWRVSMSARGMEFGAGMTAHDNPLAAASADTSAGGDG